MSITFDIPGVDQHRERLDRVSVEKALIFFGAGPPSLDVPSRVRDFLLRRKLRRKSPFEAVTSLPGGVLCSGVHPFIGAAQVAFDRHLPLTLSPDHVWIVIAQGYAHHVRLDAEELRAQFVAHDDRETLRVRRDDFVRGASDNAWTEVFSEFSAQLKVRIGEHHDRVVANFSTTDELARAVSQLVLMDAMGAYFSYRLDTRCGIPRVTLEGEPADWRALQERTASLRAFGLGWWVEPLLSVLEYLVRAAEGEVDPDFWCSMYKLESVSGGPRITGWIHNFFPYLHSVPPGQFVRNEFLDSWPPTRERHLFNGPATDDFPRALSTVPFRWEYLGEALDMLFIAGFVGVAQDEQTGSVSPALGWAVRDA